MNKCSIPRESLNPRATWQISENYDG